MCDRRKQTTSKYLKRDNRGTTIVEMIVCFALLAIFMGCAAAMITTITNLYYQVKGEIYAREISNIVMEKISSELDGAEYFGENSLDNPIIIDNSSISLYDKTDTELTVGTDEGKLVVTYSDIEVKKNGLRDDAESRYETDWKFDDQVYNGFSISEVKIYQGGKAITESIDTKYRLSGLDMTGYDNNVVLVLLKMNSPRYGDYYYYRLIKMYNVPEDYEWPSAAPSDD